MFELLTMLAGVAVFPWLCLAFLLWMAWLEDSLPAAVRRSGRTPDPEPILAIAADPVPASAEPDLPAVPGQRRTARVAQVAHAAQVAQVAQASVVARSADASLGGSTNR